LQAGIAFNAVLAIIPLIRRARIRPRVLIVDDDRDVRAIGREVLQHFGADVAEATNSEEAIQSIGTALPHLILMELSLPGKDGWTLTRQLRSDTSCASVPIIAMTGYLHPGARERAADAGFSGFLTKPCRPRTILDEVRRWIELPGRRGIQPDPRHPRGR